MKSLDAERYFSKIALPDSNGCMRWLGSTAQKYGSYFHDGRNRSAHRMGYEYWVESLPEDTLKWTLDHLCKNRWCVTPDHLELVTRGENSNRGNGPTGLNIRKTHCPRGHTYDYFYPNRNSRG